MSAPSSPTPKSEGLSVAAFTDAKASLMLPPPPPAPKITRPNISLEEDTYVSSISRIIERDYFPDLVLLKCKNAYLDAVKDGDEHRTAKLRRKLARLNRVEGVAKEEELATRQKKRKLEDLRRREASFRAETPTVADARADTPRFYSGDTVNWREGDSSNSDYSDYDEFDCQSVAGAQNERDLETVNTNMSLNAFQSKYTSEDNESFHKILDERNQKNREKYAWLWNGNKIPGYRGTEYLEWQRLNDTDQPASSPSTSTSLTIVSNDQASSTALIVSDRRPAKPDTWKSKPKNELIFGPDEGKLSNAALQSARAKEIVRVNTRFDTSESHGTETPNELSGMSSPSPSLSIDSSDASSLRASTPRVQGYSFVSARPSPSPSELGAPPMTWGAVAATPVVSKFRIAETPKREELHHKLLSSMSKRASTPKSSQARPGSGVPKFKTVPDVKKAMLTPAGKRLLSSIVSAKKGGTDVQSGNGSGTAATKREMATPMVRK
ncbi:nuclear protein DGCR14 [Lipomyces kononenkoae]|uniref:Nuclear protein DGCR14 n=1 Tax=Lipomyces kononenkoae TaxID=34357 RepID=A0ACC3SWX8_LIPKO